MKRVSIGHLVHFVAIGTKTLCGCGTVEYDIIGTPIPICIATSDPVTCPKCARVYCRVKNAPWNEVDGVALNKACHEAVKPDEDDPE